MSTPQDFSIRTNRWLGEENKSHYIPAWYEGHQNLDYEVKHLGLGQGFPISKVLPFRRWALDSEGNTLDQKTFEDQYLLYLQGFKTANTHDPRNESMPNVRAFVRMKYDRVGSLVDMDFEDDGAITKTEKYTRDGEVAPEWLAKNAEQAGRLSKVEMLSQLLKDGVLTADQFQAKLDQIFGVEASTDIPVIAGVPMIPAPPRKGGRPFGSRNKPKPPNFAAHS